MSHSGGSDGALFERFGRVYAAGQVIFEEGEPGAQMFVLQSGQVQLTRRLQGQHALVDTLDPGDFFGEMAIVNNKPRSATAVALDESRLLCIDAKTFEAMVRGNAEIAIRLIKKLAGRLEQANSQVESLMRMELGHRLVHHIRRLADQDTTLGGAPTRIAGSAHDLAEALGAPADEVAACLKRMAEAKLLVIEPHALRIAQLSELDRLLESERHPPSPPGGVL